MGGAAAEAKATRARQSTSADFMSVCQAGNNNPNLTEGKIEKYTQILCSRLCFGNFSQRITANSLYLFAAKNSRLNIQEHKNTVTDG